MAAYPDRTAATRYAKDLEVCVDPRKARFSTSWRSLNVSLSLCALAELCPAQASARANCLRHNQEVARVSISRTVGPVIPGQPAEAVGAAETMPMSPPSRPRAKTPDCQDGSFP